MEPEDGRVPRVSFEMPAGGAGGGPSAKAPPPKPTMRRTLRRREDMLRLHFDFYNLVLDKDPKKRRLVRSKPDQPARGSRRRALRGRDLYHAAPDPGRPLAPEHRPARAHGRLERERRRRPRGARRAPERRCRRRVVRRPARVRRHQVPPREVRLPGHDCVPEYFRDRKQVTFDGTTAQPVDARGWFLERSASRASTGPRRTGPRRAMARVTMS